ncbi:MAG: anti-sigma factor family protein [Dictyoglomaceae bacterium]
MKCKEAKRLISSYIDGEISLEKRKELERHLSVCISCRKELEDFEIIIKEIHNFQKIEPSLNFADNVWYRYQNEKIPEKNYRKLFFILSLIFTLIFIFLLSQKFWVQSKPQELQTFYEIHSKWGNSFIFGEPSVDFVLYQNR